MAINTKKVLIGGIVAGVVLAATDILSQTVLLGDRMAAELGAVAPGVPERLEDAGSLIVFVAMSLGLGIALAWLYAAIRPRFGPGALTAVYAGVYLWIVTAIFHWFFVVAGMMTVATFAIGATIWLVAMIVAAAAAGKLYAEEEPAAAAPPAPSPEETGTSHPGF